MKGSLALSSVVLLLVLGSPANPQGRTLADTKHNLSITGKGSFVATQESQMCIFCHTPHRTRTNAPLWNREDSTQSYLEYTSTTFAGTTTQPTGSSKLCLSCHDGSIALGMVVSNPREIAMAPGRRLLNTGGSYIGTNLQDDHPISFDYSSSGAGSAIEYRTRSSIALPVHLDDQGRVQCTSCHDPHHDPFGAFLLATDQYSSLCLACHQPQNWSDSPHSTSTATWNGSGANPWPVGNYATVAENACANCHRTHNAGAPERLLYQAAEEDNCLRCHNGNVAVQNIEADLNKPYGHNPALTQGVHDPAESPNQMSRHAECQDCHNPHQSGNDAAPAPGVPGALRGVRGLSSSGQVLESISNGYELCYRCHATNQGGSIDVPRQLEQMNVRMEFNRGNPSFHPIEGPGANSDVPSLLPPWTTSSIMTCGDCHQSDSSPTFGGTGPAGPHGSVFRGLLGARYETADFTRESASAYALCYRCHSRSSILNDTTFDDHGLHIRDADTPCSACHDSHGIANGTGESGGDHTHLINFDTSIARPLNGELFYRDDGFRRGSCTLVCHDKEHDNLDY